MTRKLSLLSIAAASALIIGLLVAPLTRQVEAQPADINSAQLQRMPKIGAYPPNASVLQATSGNVAAGVSTATLTSSAGNMAWIFGFDVNGGGATAASVVDCTVTGLVGATAHYSLPVAAGATASLTPLSIRYPEPIPASAVNTNIVVSCPSLGAGNTNTTINAYGFLSSATAP
jgi:hypothetical protein